jgi:hypothetical protein
VTITNDGVVSRPIIAQGRSWKEGPMLNLVLLIFAFVLALIQAFRPWTTPFPVPHLGWLAIALFLLTHILGAPGLR